MNRVQHPREAALLALTVSAGLAVILATVGHYGLRSDHVADRTHKFVLRTVLGANRLNLDD